MKHLSKILVLLLSLCLVLSLGAFASGEPSGDPSGDPSAEAGAVKPGTYTDGEHTLVIADDLTFSMDKTGTNMDGAEFAMTVTGVINGDGSVTLTGIYDGDLNVMELATEEQIAADTASVMAALGR